jgi:arylsulfatase A-like enzyme
MLQRLIHIGVVFFVLAIAVSTRAADATRPPNFVVVLMDDMGWREVGFMGNSFIETPNIDRLAKQGLVFTQAYASAPNCAPTRACLMSGQYTPRHGIYTVVDPRQPPGSPWHKLQAAESKSELDTNIVTIPETLSSHARLSVGDPKSSRDGPRSGERGYATGFFGMWNLGRGRTGPVTPGGQGFQKVVFPENLGFGKDEYFDDDKNYLSDRLTDEVLKFIDDNRERPFFVYYPDHAVHAPFNPKPDLLAKYERKLEKSKDRRDDPKHAATVEAVDQNVGRIVEHLAKLKLTDNTYVIFTSDNGATQQYTPPLRGGKGELYEGGIRVPLVVTGPGIKKPGSKCDAPVASVDLYPTLVELAGLKMPSEQVHDGVSLVPAFSGATTLNRPRLFWHFPCYVGKATPCSAVREGDFKLIEFFEDGGRVELFNLKTDPNEERDLAKSQPDKAAALTKTLRAWQKETGALLPEGPNPKYDPKAERPRGGQSGMGQGGGQNKGQPKRKGQESGKKKGQKSAAVRFDPRDVEIETADATESIEIGTRVRTEAGFLVFDGEYLAPPYNVVLSDIGVQVNGRLIDRFDATADERVATNQFETMVGTLMNDELVVAFADSAPICFRSASYRPLAQLTKRPIPDDFPSNLLAQEASLSVDQVARWAELIESFQANEEFVRRASVELSLFEDNLRLYESKKTAQWLLAHSAYPLTAIAMLCVALAAGHLLISHSQLLSGSEDRPASEAERAVKKTLAFIVAFSALDLVWTVIVSQAGEMHELHPLGSSLIDNPLLLAGFKGVTTLVAVGILFTLRHWPAARKASWHVCLICLLLAGRWVTVGGLLI